MNENKSWLYRWYAVFITACIAVMTTMRDWNDSIKTIKRKP